MDLRPNRGIQFILFILFIDSTRFLANYNGISVKVVIFTH